MPIRDNVSYRARLFGRFGVSACDDGDVTPVGRKARALLAFLILAKGDAVARDRLAGLLWGGRDEPQARASLRQTLYELRSFTGGATPLIVTSRTQIRISAARLETDLDALRRAADAGHGAAIADLIGDRPQDPLAGLDGIDPAFNDWLAAERTHLRDERQRRIGAVARVALAAGDASSAARLAGALLAADPTDEMAATLALEAAHARGDRDGLLKVHARHTAALARELNVPPSLAIAATYARLTGDHTPLPITSAQPERAGIASPRRIGWRRIALAILAVLVLTDATWWLLGRTAPADQKLVVVERLKVAPGDVAARGLRRDLADDLSRMILGDDAALSVADPDDSGNRTADFRVTGDAATDGGLVHATVRLLQRQDGTILWSSSFARPIGERDSLRGDIASRLGDVAICALGSHYPTPADMDLESTRLYLAACEQKHADWVQSVKLLTQLTERRPDFAHGWAMLAAGTASVAFNLPNELAASEFQRANGFARKALAIDPHDGEAYYALAAAQKGLADWPQAMAFLAAGHAADPDNSPVNAETAWDLALVGRTREAVVFSRRAVAHDPFSPSDTPQLARLLAATGQAQAAADLMRDATRRWPDNRSVAYAAFTIAARTGDPAMAQAMVAAPDRTFNLRPAERKMWTAFLAARRSPTSANIDAVDRVAGDPAAGAEDLLDRVADLVQLGRVDAAYRLYDRSAAPPWSATGLLFSSVMAPFRSDPRFLSVAAREGLTQLWRRTNHWPDFCADPSLRCQGSPTTR
jgi:DNA-binding SARP family transcriptional activator